MHISNRNTDTELIQELGRRLRAHRLRQNLRQSDLARQTGLIQVTISNIENGKDSRMSSYIKILRALNLLDELEQFLPDPGISPMEMLRINKPARQRASQTE